MTRKLLTEDLLIAAMLATLATVAHSQSVADKLEQEIIEEYKVDVVKCHAADYQVKMLVEMSLNKNGTMSADEKQAAITDRINSLKFALFNCEGREEAKGSQWAQWEANAEKARAVADRVKREQLEAARVAGLPSPKLGMTGKQVREKTNWGHPSHINTTGGKWGTHEQWVYPNGSYLYFENGKLTAFQQ